MSGVSFRDITINGETMIMSGMITSSVPIGCGCETAIGGKWILTDWAAGISRITGTGAIRIRMNS